MANPGESSSTGATVILTINTNLPNRRGTFTNWDDSSEDEVIYTPTASGDTSSDEMMDTPTTPTPMLFVTNPDLAQDNVGEDYDDIAPTPASPETPEAPVDNDLIPVQNLGKLHKFSTAGFESAEACNNASSNSTAFDTAGFWEPNPHISATAGMTRGEAAAFNMQALSEAVMKSKEYITREEQAAIDRAIAESQGPRVDYSPANREQQRIMIAFAEDLTTEKGHHTKEDDTFFAEILGEEEEEEDCEDDSDDTLEGDDDRT